jgi:hypothetical protein
MPSDAVRRLAWSRWNNTPFTVPVSGALNSSSVGIDRFDSLIGPQSSVEHGIGKGIIFLSYNVEKYPQNYNDSERKLG